MVGKSPLTQEQKDLICNLYKEGKSCQRIKDVLGTSSVSAIRNVLRRRGVKLREPSQAVRRLSFDEHYFVELPLG